MFMEILFDGEVFRFQKAGGINRYFAEIVSGLPPDWKPTITGVKAFGQNVPCHPNLRVENPPAFRPQRAMQYYGRRWWKPRIARRVKLFHPTYYYFTSHFRLSDFTCPIVTTVYDMIYARFPGQAEGPVGVSRSQREAVLRADRIVCISRYTEQDLLELIPEVAEKTTVIHLGSSFQAVESGNPNEIFEEPAFLFVGGRGGYKNFLLLLRAFARAVTIRPGIRLNVAGAPLTPEERWQIYFLGITDRVTSIEYPDEAALKKLYRRSVALLYPSRYEGFGIPPLEAMACGTIAVTGNTTSLPEVVGDGGIMLNPADEDAWTEHIVKLSEPFPERAGLLERGRRHQEQFSWAECVRRHVEIYEALD